VALAGERERAVELAADARGALQQAGLAGVQRPRYIVSRLLAEIMIIMPSRPNNPST
jgi:hypothetical protein